MLEKIIKLLHNKKFDLANEKALQAGVEKILIENNVEYRREYDLGNKNIPDFIIEGICIEIKIKGSARAIFKQLERYAAFDEVKQILLLTNRAMGLPPTINDKKTSILNIGKAWL